MTMPTISLAPPKLYPAFFFPLLLTTSPGPRGAEGLASLPLIPELPGLLPRPPGVQLFLVLASIGGVPGVVTALDDPDPGRTFDDMERLGNFMRGRNEDEELLDFI